VFLAVGQIPNTQQFAKYSHLDDNGYFAERKIHSLKQISMGYLSSEIVPIKYIGRQSLSLVPGRWPLSQPENVFVTRFNREAIMDKCQLCAKSATVHMTQVTIHKTTVICVWNERASKLGLLTWKDYHLQCCQAEGKRFFCNETNLPANGLMCSKCSSTRMSFKETGR
jgi:hypothetical protein